MLAMYDLQNADPADLFWTVLTNKKKRENCSKAVFPTMYYFSSKGFLLS